MRFGRGLAGLAILMVLAASGGCTGSFFPAAGPKSGDIRAGQQKPDGLPYALVRLTPGVVDLLAHYAPRIAGVWPDKSPPKEIHLGIGDVVSVTIFEAAAGGLFIPIEAGVRPGNFVQLPNQNVDTKGNISVPYAGAIRAKDRTPAEVQQSIVEALRNRAIEPQAVVALITQNTSLISVLGEVNTPNRFPATAAGEHVLDAITRAGGPRSAGYDLWVMLQRDNRRAIAPFGALVYEPENNNWVHPNDTLYLYKEPQTFVAFGAFSGGSSALLGNLAPFTFDAWRLSLAEAVAKAGGLNDTQADPASVFLYRGETREAAEHLGIDTSNFPGPIIPVVYEDDFRDPAGYFLATKLQMRSKDVLFAANAGAIDSAKVLNYIRLVTATANDPIVAANNVFVLRNNINTKL